jgi:hypothetical protein
MSTYTPIASQTLGSAAASVTFSGIPQGYTDLVIVFNGTSASSHTAGLQFNSDTGSNYSNTYLLGESGATASGRASNTTSSSQFYPNTTIGTAVINIANYSNTTTYKTILTRWSNTDNYALANVGLWRSTAAINTVLLTGNGTNFQTGSTFSIYGIAGGQASAKASGGIIATSGAYTYHTFTSSGGFIPSQNLTVDYLVIAGGGGGGGGGGSGEGGGGGAGGLRSTVTATGGGGSLETALSLTAGITYPAIVGAGGVGSSNDRGTNGTSSTFATITSIGGGGGGGRNGEEQSGFSGGSGGGGGQKDNATNNFGLGTTNQGFNGGNGMNNGTPSDAGGGGGGGSGAAGSDAPFGTTGGAGGSSVSVSITGSSVAYAGGGGGAGSTTGGASGGGGAGAGNVTTPATINSGSGGGGTASAGGAGGSGIVIVRYLT